MGWWSAGFLTILLHSELLAQCFPTLIFICFILKIYAKEWSRASSTGVTWELIESADSQDPRQTYQIRTCIVRRFPRITVSTINCKVYLGMFTQVLNTQTLHSEGPCTWLSALLSGSWNELCLFILYWALPFHFILSLPNYVADLRHTTLCQCFSNFGRSMTQLGYC